MSAPENGSAAPQTILQATPAQIVRSPFNRTIDPKDPATLELTANVKEHGIIVPLIVRPFGPLDMETARDPNVPRWELVAGERRWLSAAAAKLATVPVIVRRLSDREAIELQAIENEQRKDLTPIEQAEKYSQLLEQYKKDGLTPEKAMEALCKALSKKTSTVYEAIRLLKLPAAVKEAVASGKLPISHAGLIAKLPEGLQAEMARAIAPGKALSRKEEDELEKLTGYLDDGRDEKTGLVSFRSAREVVDDLVTQVKAAEQYEKIAAGFRAKGGTALTFIESRKLGNDGLLRAGDYLHDYSGYVREVIKGVKELPAEVMRPAPHDPAKPEMVYRKTELLAALKKAGVKPRSYGGGGGGSSAGYAKRERERLARERANKTVLAGLSAPILAAAKKRTAKVPWHLLVPAMASWSGGMRVCKARGWACTYNTMRKVLGERLVKIPQNQIAGVMAEILVDHTTVSHSGSYKPEFVALGKFYGVDVPSLAKQLREKGPPPVQTSGKVKRRAKPSAQARKRIAEAMKARWAARRKAAAK